MRAGVAMCLARIGKASESAVDALTAAPADPHPAVRAFASEALSKTSWERQRLAQVLNAGLAEVVANSNEMILERSVGALVRLRLHNASELRRLLLDKRDPVASAAWTALAALGAEAAPAVNLLDELWTKERNRVCGVLAGIGSPAARFAPQLETLAATKALSDRLGTLWILNDIAPGPRCAALVAEVFSAADEDEDLRQETTNLLLRMPQHAQAEVPRLVRHLQENAGAIYASAILSHVGAPAAPALVALLEARDADSRAWAAWTLGGMAPVPESAHGPLRKALGDASALVRAAAAQALERLASGCRPEEPRDWPRGVPWECGYSAVERAQAVHLAICGPHALPASD